MASKQVYATLLSQVTYVAGALVLHHSLQNVGAKYPLVIMYTPNMPSDAMDVFRRRGIDCIQIESLVPERWKNKKEARFQDTWTKLRVFGLIQFDRVVLLDSDMLITKNIDDLFDLELPSGWIAASHVCACNPLKIASYPKDWIPANCPHTAVKAPLDPPPVHTSSSPRPYGQLNSGLVVFHPSMEIFERIVQYLDQEIKSATDLDSRYYFADQDLITEFFQGKWKPLPWYYNALRPLREIHPKMWDDEVVRVVHYILKIKPWSERVPENPPEDMRFVVVNRWWWKEYEALAKEMKDTDVEGLKWLIQAVVPPLNAA